MKTLGIRLVVALLLLCPLAAADVQEQRARLPPPATCTDAVEGVWMSHTRYPRVGQWYMFTLTIRRKPGDAVGLTGDIHSLYWEGGPGGSEPPACGPGVFRQAVDEPAEGTIVAGRITFGGTGWRASPSGFCGAAETAYNPDHFSGAIDPALQEFQTVVSDGGIFQGDPTVFRRIRCLDPPVTPHVEVAPPPFYPGGRAGGCGC